MRPSRRGGRVAEGARLESVFTGNRNAGSNPAPSARSPRLARGHPGAGAGSFPVSLVTPTIAMRPLVPALVGTVFKINDSAVGRLPLDVNHQAPAEYRQRALVSEEGAFAHCVDVHSILRWKLFDRHPRLVVELGRRKPWARAARHCRRSDEEQRNQESSHHLQRSSQTGTTVTASSLRRLVSSLRITLAVAASHSA